MIPMTTAPPPFRLERGARPLIVSMPHVGTHLPRALAARMTPQALVLADTDWHVDRLYAFAADLGATLLVATHSRYVVDLNRPRDDHNLYPGQDTTGLCPVDTFDRAPLYRDAVPDAEDIEARCRAIYDPYHAALAAEIARLRELHGQLALWDAHSIRSVVPRFFAGRLPDLNLGTADGKSCDARLAKAVTDAASLASGYSYVVNGRFKGGHITRHYGSPARGVHAIQLEMAQCVYMDEAPPFTYHAERAAQVEPHLRAMLEAALRFVESR
jgi:N-formylglutamate deformylase